jgi:adenylate cyclase 8
MPHRLVDPCNNDTRCEINNLSRKERQIIHEFNTYPEAVEINLIPNQNFVENMPAILKKQEELSNDEFYEEKNKREILNNSFTSIKDQPYFCVHPEHLVFTWVLCMIALATTLKLYFLVKTALALVMVTVYTLLIVVHYPQVFQQKVLDDQ